MMVRNPIPLGGPLFQEHVVSQRIVESGGVVFSPKNDMILRRAADLNQRNDYGQSQVPVKSPQNLNQDIFLEQIINADATRIHYDFGPAIARTPPLVTNPYLGGG